MLSRLIFALIVVDSATAMAQPTEDPEALIRQGIELRRQGDDLKAEGYFKRAYQIAQTPRATAQLGLVELALKDYMAAELYLTRALVGDDAWVRTYQKILEESRRTAREHLMQVTVTDTPTGTKATVEGEPIIELRPDGVFWLSAGATVTFAAAGRSPLTIALSGAPGTLRRISLGTDGPLSTPAPVQDNATRTPSPPTTAARSEPRIDDKMMKPKITRLIGASIGAAGLALAAVGLVVVLDGNAKRDDIESAASRGTRAYSPTDGDWHTLQLRGTAFLVAGAAAVAGGAALFFFSGSETTSRSTAVSIAPGVGGLGVSGRF
jgi:hypothetical protein